MSRVPMTVAGEHLLREEIHRLKEIERPKIVNEISVAREHGDLRENAEYHAAREKQSFVEGRIKEIDGQLSNSQVIDVTKLNADGKIIFGTTVKLKKDGEVITYQIVGEDEADIKAGKISYQSPLARALLGKEEGETAVVDAPAGALSYEIVNVTYA